MRMKTLIHRLLILIVATTFVTSSFAFPALSETVPQKKEKEKKEKKTKKEKAAFNWADVRPDKLSGTEEMDNYILYCDTIWDRIQSYKDEITFFKLDTTWALDNNDTIKIVRITDQEGQPRNFSQSLKQGTEMALTGTNILLDVTLISLMTTNAGLSIASNPLLVFGYTKCLKGGPQIVKLAYNEVKGIIEETKKQTEQTKKLKSSQMEGSTDQAIILAKEEGEEPDIENMLLMADLDLGTNDGEVDISEIENIVLEIPDEPELDKK